MRINRRNALALGLGLAAGSALLEGNAPASAAVSSSRAMRDAIALIPQQERARVIVDNDFSGDPDGFVALAHQLMSSTTRVSLITSLPLNQRFEAPGIVANGAALGAKEARELLRILHKDAIPVVAGPEHTRSTRKSVSDAAQAIVREAMREDSLPLIFTCGGPLTNLAAALRADARIAERMTVIWIGGGSYPAGGWEYNLITDLAAARYVIEHSQVPLWQVPVNAYRQMQYSVARLNLLMRQGSGTARWLYERFNHPPAWVKVGGTWPLGDSPLVLLTALSTESSSYYERPAKRILKGGLYGKEVPRRTIRVFDSVDARLTFDDMEALLALHG